MTSQNIVSQSAPAALLQTAGRMGVRMPFAAGEEIYAQGEPCQLFYQVAQGAVRTTRLMSDGRRQVGDFYYAGDFLGLESGDEHRFSAEALEDCEILVIKRSALHQGVDDAALLQRALWTATARELERAQEHILWLGRKTAAERVAGFILETADRCPGEMAHLPMGRQDVADYLGLTIETVSRMITQLQTNKLVEFQGCRHFRLQNKAALRRLAAH